MTTEETDAMARRIIDSNLYMTLGTADEAGRPWVSPVYFAVEGYTEFFWVSSPEAKHSRNIADRSEVSIVIFDSTVPANTGEAVYMSAMAEAVGGGDVERGIDIFSRRSVQHGAGTWTKDDVAAPERLRLYRAIATEHFVLGRDDRRIPVLTDRRGNQL